MSRGRTALGLVVMVTGTAALPGLLAATAGRPDLFVHVPSTHDLRSGDPRQQILRAAPVRLGPDPTRIRSDSLLGGASPGLDLVTWRTDYGEAWRREVTWPSLAGPFAEEGSDVCGYGVWLGAGLFDTTKAGLGLKKIMAQRLASIFPYTISIKEYNINVMLPELSSSDFRIQLADGGAWIDIEARLVDRTLLSARFPVRVVSRRGTPAMERIRGSGPIVRFEGPSRDEIVRQASDEGASKGGLLIGLLGFAIGGPIGGAVGLAGGSAAGAEYGSSRAESEIPDRAGRLVAEEIDRALEDLSLGMHGLRRPWSPDTSRPRDSIRVRLDGDPRVSTAGIALPLCTSISISAPKVDPAMPGPIRWNARMPGVQGESDGAPTIELTMNEDALSQALHYFWQAGKLRELGRSSMVLHGLAEEVRAAAFDFTGLDPRLPPTLAPSMANGDTLSFVLANVEAGKIGARRVLAHGLLGLEFHQQGDAVQLSAEVNDLRVSCQEDARDGFMLTPCLSDLLPVARSSMASPMSYTLPGGEVLARLPRLSFQGMNLEVSDLRVATSGRPIALRLGVQARIEAP